jgi:hypothetical protein
LIASPLILSAGLVQGARAANDPPADLCALLPAADVSKILGQTYNAPEKSVAPRPYANTAQGTDCHYSAKGSVLWFRAYVDPSATAATELFDKLGKFYQPQTPVPGLGDEAYFDREHALHVRKGKVRFYLNVNSANFSPAVEKQVKDLANKVIAQL